MEQMQGIWALTRENIRKNMSSMSFHKWIDVLTRTGVDPAFYANRRFGLDEVLPWDIIDCGVTKEYLLRERNKAYEGKTTPSCAEHCNGCGANKLGGKNVWCK